MRRLPRGIPTGRKALVACQCAAFVAPLPWAALIGDPMKCPTCPDATLVMADRQGIEIDYCPVPWRVAGTAVSWTEIIERGTQAAPQRAAPPTQTHQPPPQQHYPQATRHPDFVDSDFKPRSPYGYRKPKSWLSEIFD